MFWWEENFQLEFLGVRSGRKMMTNKHGSHKKSEWWILRNPSSISGSPIFGIKLPRSQFWQRTFGKKIRMDSGSHDILRELCGRFTMATGVFHSIFFNNHDGRLGGIVDTSRPHIVILRNRSFPKTLVNKKYCEWKLSIIKFGLSQLVPKFPPLRCF